MASAEVSMHWMERLKLKAPAHAHDTQSDKCKTPDVSKGPARPIVSINFKAGNRPNQKSSECSQRQTNLPITQNNTDRLALNIVTHHQHFIGSSLADEFNKFSVDKTKAHGDPI